ncbi:aminopeptidase N-like [Conger conger]|uniref:aminopeptidase N-like n=1 Tax=Conger conger TaxID=82655 RepID=UPI002A5B0875|nr:aminopeptidase N-like [Conger conger]
MSKRVYVSKAAAVATVTVAALALITVIGMIIFHNIRTKECPHLLQTTFPPTTTSTPTGPPPDMRLPGDLIPESYKIYLQTHLYLNMTDIENQNFDFTGNSTVKFKCVNATNTIYIHSKGLDLTLIGVADEKGKEMATHQVQLVEDERNFVTIELVDSLRVDGLYYLSTAFKGQGFHQSGLSVAHYTGEKNEERFLVFSQMEPSDARRVFPCFDEPAMKAIFNITIIHRKGSIALSNMPQKDQVEMDIDGEEWLITEFHPTKKMSTYVLSFIVFNFESKETNYGSYTLKTWARPEVVSAGLVDYAHSITGNILDFFEEYTGIKYPLGKLDQVGIQGFEARGMENWGLIMYSEGILTYNEEVFTTTEKGIAAIVIAHEVAHQWFGNLVTMKWWNDLWLKEGFSTYMSYLAMDRVEPGGNMKDLISVQEIQATLGMEVLVAEQHLTTKEEDIQSKSDINSLYNIIIYNKGAVVLRMIAEFLPEGVFQNGVQSYLKANQYSNAETQNLWSHLQMAVDNASFDIAVAEVMDTWTQQSGYPMITINTTSGEVSQEHFSLDTDKEQTNRTWKVPIKTMKSDSEVIELFLLTVEGPVSNPAYLCNENEWILASVNYTGYYRVNYNPENWEKLLQQLETDHRKIPTRSRAQLIDDAFTLARKGKVNRTLPLRITKYLLKDTEFIPWESARKYLENIILMFDRTEVYGTIKAYVRKLVGPLYDHFENFTWNSSIPDSCTAQLNQINAVKLACAIELPKCQKMAADLFEQWRKSPTTNPIHPNLRPMVYCSAIASGGELEWDFAWEMLQTSPINQERERLMEALACTKHVWILNRYMLYALDPDYMQFIDIVTVIGYIAKNVIGHSLAWDFVRSHLNSTKPPKMIGFVLIDLISHRFSTEYELQQIKEIQAQEDGKSYGSDILEKISEKIRSQIKWMEENKQTVSQWFQKEASQGSSPE